MECNKINDLVSFDKGELTFFIYFNKNNTNLKITCYNESRGYSL